MRIIPRLDIKGSHVIKGIHMEGLRKVGDPAEMSIRYYKQGADELIYIDVVASLYGRNYAIEVIEKVSNDLFIPLTIGGGVRNVDDIRALLNAGADKVAANSGFITNPAFIEIAAKKFGSQCIVGMVEAKRMNGGWEALYENGRERSGRDAVKWAIELTSRGVGELLVTSVDQEGTCQGFDLELIAEISTGVKVPVIASGGTGCFQDVEEVIEIGKADAVAVAHLFHYNKTTPDQLKVHLVKSFEMKGWE